MYVHPNGKKTMGGSVDGEIVKIKMEKWFNRAIKHDFSIIYIISGSINQINQ